ncbi:cupin domain-containing protein [Pseudochelatococcus sp. B33]
MSDTAEATPQTKNAGATKAGAQGYIFQFAELDKIDAGKGYSTAFGSVVEGERTQVGLMNKARGTGARPHSHPNEQWNYVVKGRLRVHIEGEEERIVGPGTLLYFPPNKVHATVALPDEDVVFFVVKDLSHGIVGTAADGTTSGPHYDEGFAPKG